LDSQDEPNTANKLYHGSCSCPYQTHGLTPATPTTAVVTATAVATVAVQLVTPIKKTGR
jgi:hypothetical protein